MSGRATKFIPPWTGDRVLRDLLELLNRGDDVTRIAGGAVRDALLGRAIGDYDFATTLRPEIVEKRCSESGYQTVPTGKEHGTITVIAERRPFEVTTLRRDVETYGRHARVTFGTDWRRDAMRRDFTINALYADFNGQVYDFVGGFDDLKSRRIRFIGEAEQRIREDYLRILRFFRFFAQFGSGRPDAEGIKACVKLKSDLVLLSQERIWSEVKKILAVAQPYRALLWMRQSSVLSVVLPETEKWGIEAVEGLQEAETRFELKPDPLLRLEAIVPPDKGLMAALGDRLKLSNAERKRLKLWSMLSPIPANTPEPFLTQMLYRSTRQAVEDRLHVDIARDCKFGSPEDPNEARRQQLQFARNWNRPIFPVTGRDLVKQGLKEGPHLGQLLKKLEKDWINSNFTLAKSDLLAMVKRES